MMSCRDFSWAFEGLYEGLSRGGLGVGNGRASQGCKGIGFQRKEGVDGPSRHYGCSCLFVLLPRDWIANIS